MPQILLDGYHVSISVNVVLSYLEINTKHLFIWPLWTQRVVLESPPSFCNGLGTIYIASLHGRTFRSYYQSMGSEFRYALGKVLGTQDRLILRLASHHCVLCLNPIKNYLNTYILNSHTH